MVTVREVQFEDLPDVAELFRGAGWGTPSRDGWERVWIDNPASKLIPGLNRGWVLEEEQNVVGFISNIVQQYKFGHGSLIAAVGAALVVDPDYRGHSLRLVSEFCKQKNVDLLLITTAAIQTSKIFEFLKFTRIPQPEYDVDLYWILRERSFLAAALRKKQWRTLGSELVGTLLAPPLWVFLRLTGRAIRSGRSQCDIRIIEASDVDAQFDDLWQRRCAERRRLLACRDSETLRWHFAAGNRVYPPRLVCAYIDDRLVGYLAMVRRDNEQLELRRMLVADIFVENDDERVTSELLGAAARDAASSGASMLEVNGEPTQLRSILRKFRPFELINESWPYLYRANDADLQETLRTPDVWYAGPYDGDSSL